MQGCKEAGIPAFGTLWDFVRVFHISHPLPTTPRPIHTTAPFLSPNLSSQPIPVWVHTIVDARY